MKIRIRISFGLRDLRRAANAPPWVAKAIVVIGVIGTVLILILMDA